MPSRNLGASIPCSWYYLNVNSIACLRRFSYLPYQRDDDFAVRVCLESVWLLEVLADDLVVVDFTVDSQCNAAIIVHQRLCTAVWMLLDC